MPAPERPAGFGRIARYAWGMDYHRVLNEKCRAFVRNLEAQTKHPIGAAWGSDAVSQLERALAARAKLGFVGKNSMLIRRQEGSYFFLAEVLFDLPIEGVENENNSVLGDCGRCVRCQTHCPTSAIVSDRVVDARRCISYLTIEKRASLSEAEREMIGEWLFGCDVCQEVCPFNHRPMEPSFREFEPQRGAGPLLNLSELLSIRSNRQFERRFAGLPLLRPRRVGLLRNAAVVAANTEAWTVLPVLLECLEEESSAVVREHCLWAAVRLSAGLRPGLLDSILGRALRDPSEAVRLEARRLAEVHT